jgi:long-chain acyl-CoA synthetase
MQGYHARPDENAKVFTADEGLRTGDLGRIDEDGYLFITGRVKEQYKLETGKYVVPTPLEEQLALSPFINLVMLHGADRPYNVALVVIEPSVVRAWATEHGHTLDSDLTRDPIVHDLISRELERYGAAFRSYEKPRAFEITDEELTTANGMITPSLKLKRQAIHARFGAALDALYETTERPLAEAPVRAAPSEANAGRRAPA